MYLKIRSRFFPEHFFVFADDAPQKQLNDLTSLTERPRAGAVTGMLIPLIVGGILCAVGGSMVLNEESFDEKVFGGGLLLVGALLAISVAAILTLRAICNRSARFFVRERQYAATSSDQSLVLLLRKLIMPEHRVEGIPAYANPLVYSLYLEPVREILVEYFRNTKEADEGTRRQLSREEYEVLWGELEAKAAATIDLVEHTVNSELMRLQKESPAT